MQKGNTFHLWNAREKGRDGTDGMGITRPEGGKKKRDPGKEKGIAESEENPREGIEKRELNQGGKKRRGRSKQQSGKAQCSSATYSVNTDRAVSQGSPGMGWKEGRIGKAGR